MAKTPRTIETTISSSVEEKKDRRGKIKSDFPKHSLEEALRVPNALEHANGGQPLPPTETAIALGASPGSSEFRTILSSSIKYGLTSGSFNTDRVTLEQLGRNIVEPTSNESKNASLVTAALTPPTFKAIYEYFKGKKLPESVFFQNTVVREFDVPREHAEKCVSVFHANMIFVGLIREAKTGLWLATDAVGTPIMPTEPNPENVIDEDVPQDEPDTVVSKPDTPVPTERKDAKNAIFLGHGKNKKPLEQLKAILDQYKIPYKVAIEEPNKFRPISQKVAETMQECGAAILIFSADEEFTDSTGHSYFRPNENVIYELGASSVLYGGKIVIFKEDGVELSTNFRDIGYISFQKDALSSKMNELFGELISFGLIKVTVGS